MILGWDLGHFFLLRPLSCCKLDIAIVGLAQADRLCSRVGWLGWGWGSYAELTAARKSQFLCTDLALHSTWLLPEEVVQREGSDHATLTAISQWSPIVTTGCGRTDARVWFSETITGTHMGHQMTWNRQGSCQAFGPLTHALSSCVPWSQTQNVQERSTEPWGEQRALCSV